MNDDPKTIVRDGYDAMALRYLDWAKDSAIRRRYLEKLLARIETGAAILELGCGAGIPATQALSAYGNVTAVDISPAQIALLQANVPSATAICADMMSLDFPPNSFDAVAAFYALTHLPREEHAAMLLRIAHWLKPGGIFVASMGAKDAPGAVETDWLGAKNFFSQFDADTNCTLVVDAGLSILESEIANQDLAGEEHVEFLWLIATKR